MYVLKRLFRKYEANNNIITFENSKKGIIGVIPVFRSLELLKMEYPNEDWIEIEELR